MKLPLGNLNDDELMAHVALGNKDAFAILMERHIDRSLAIAQRIVHNRSDAEDIVQEAFLKVWTWASHWRSGEAKLSTWLYRVTVNLCLDLKRRPTMETLAAAGEIPDPAANAQTLVERQQTDSAVVAAIAALPERQQAAFALCYSGNLTNIEAAETLAISVGALEALLVRARRSLRERLKDKLG